LGILLAGQKEITLRFDWLLLALVIFIFGNFNALLWETTGLTFVLLSLSAIISLLKHAQRECLLMKCLVFYGGISFHLFMVNGFLRSPFHRFAETYNVWWLDNLSALTSLFFSTLFAISLRWLDNLLRLKLLKHQSLV
ncbi:MAG: hypothetical protein ACU84J_05770, partial [Gammaproteobacteria bacterium]